MEKIFSKSENFNSEYSCAVVRVGECTPIEGSDFLSKTFVFGTQIVVRKDQVKEGDLMIYAANETQLNEKFLSVNNCYDVSCREKNANKEYVDELYAPYIPIKEKADKLRGEAKKIKNSIEASSKQAAKVNRQLKNKNKELEKLEAGSQEYESLYKEVEKLKDIADKNTSAALSKTTQYTNLKKQIDDIVKSGANIIEQVKKNCGYMNKYGRVRCLVLKNTASFGLLFSPNDLLKYNPNISLQDVEDYVGQEFDTVCGEIFVKVYMPPVKEFPQRQGGKNVADAQKKLNKLDKMIDGEFFFHYHTEQFEKDLALYNPDDVIDISVKMHGTSIIVGKVHVKELVKLNKLQKVYNKLAKAIKLPKWLQFNEYNINYGQVCSSRTVIKNKYLNENVGDGFYNNDLWTEYGNIIYPYLNEGMTIYGEICGYQTGSQKMIQKHYDYGCKEGENLLMVYRITHTIEEEIKLPSWKKTINRFIDKTGLFKSLRIKDTETSKYEDTVQDVELTTRIVKEMMRQRGDENYKRIIPIPVVYHGALKDLYEDIDYTSSTWRNDFLERLKYDKNFCMEEKEPLCNNDVPREGLVIRKEFDTIPRADKLKTISFKLKEAVMVDSGEMDIESLEGYQS